MNNQNAQNIIVKDADIRWFNFSGRSGQYNPAGKRTFALFIGEDLAEELLADGWNVRKREREGSDVVEYYLNVEVNFDYYKPPIVKLIQGKRGMVLDESNIKLLDTVSFVRADVVIRPRYWEVNGKQGIKAYLHTLRFEAEEDYFADEDEDIIF